MNRQPIEGTYKIKSSDVYLFTKLHGDYNFRIIDSRKEGKSVFIVPVLADGSEASTRTSAKLCTWAQMKWLERVQ